MHLELTKNYNSITYLVSGHLIGAVVWAALHNIRCNCNANRISTTCRRIMNARKVTKVGVVGTTHLKDFTQTYSNLTKYDMDPRLMINLP